MKFKKKHSITIANYIIKNWLYTKKTRQALGACLYVINKQAKKYRDSQRKMATLIYDNEYNIDITTTHHNILQASKAAKEKMYKYKNAGLFVAMWLYNLEKLKIENIHKIEEDIPAPLVRIEDFTFHYLLPNYQFKNPEKYEKLKEVSSTKKEDTELPTTYQAIKIIDHIINILFAKPDYNFFELMLENYFVAELKEEIEERDEKYHDIYML